MLSTPFYNGQGLGNQLHNYVTVKCLALDKGYDFGVMFPERFKGTFMDLDMGVKVLDADIPVEGREPRSLPEPLQAYYREAMIGNGEYDPQIFELKDNTLVHGNLQGEDYFKHRRKEIAGWLKLKGPIQYQDMDKCIINFRGGEYRYVPEFFLPQSYWDNAIAEMRKVNPQMKFEVHTDDAETARKFFPEFKVIQDIEKNWKAVRYASYIILSNSSFGFLPAWLNDLAQKVIAPKFWGRHNKGYWFMEQNKSDRFTYL